MAEILWVDDYAGRGGKERMGFDALIWFVEKHGHKVVIAATPERIRECLREVDRFALILLDIIMEPLSVDGVENTARYGGMDVLEALKRQGSRVPIVILSVMTPSMVRSESARRGLDLMQLGVREVRRKGSITPTELAEIVEKCLQADS